MSQPELKLVWINGTALGSRSQKRRQRAQMAEQPVPNKTGVESTKGWQSYFDRKQAVTYLIVAIIGSVLTLIGQATIGLWSTISENQESRLIEKIRKDEPPASNIKTKVIKAASWHLSRPKLPMPEKTLEL